MRTMYDSVDVSTIPANAQMVAGYVDGLYANVYSLQRRFPHAVVVRIAVSSRTNDGHVLDVEPGDATPATAVAWVQMRRRAGVDPSVYCNTSQWPSVRKAFRDAGVPEPHYWVAQWDNTPSIPTGAVAKQYANPTLSHGQYDVSVVADHWPGVDAANNPRPVPVPAIYVVVSGDTLSGIAARYGLSLRTLLELNPGITNPDLIYPGQKIRISGASGSPHVNATYKVVKGDTLTSIAAAHGLTLATIEMLNPQIKDFNVITPGMTIWL